MLQEPGQSVCLKLLYYFYIIKDYNKIGEIVFYFQYKSSSPVPKMFESESRRDRNKTTSHLNSIVIHLLG